ncbi:hypothetical protein ABZ791_21025 [Streptomyces huasconensis]|uniref:Uncharacterized protein n=1 Tax=Streptomyces huasconensis TaxID=1854574 RepID=A0ABV3LTD3_9ACTN
MRTTTATTTTTTLWRPTGPEEPALVAASGSGGVTRFEADSAFLGRYPVRQAGGETQRGPHRGRP